MCVSVYVRNKNYSVTHLIPDLGMVAGSSSQAKALYQKPGGILGLHYSGLRCPENVQQTAKYWLWW